MSRNKISSVIDRQVPEFIREDYPVFVEFVKAYYEFLQENYTVDYTTVRDLDTTLDDFIINFKKEIAYNVPYLVEDERFFLQRIKDIYLAKGSAASYSLLFKLLYNKEIQLEYPGSALLRASDGYWTQENSIFAKVNFGDAEDVIGKLVEIHSGSDIIRVQVDRKQELTGEIDRIISLGNNVYEFFIDRRFYGKISPGNVIRWNEVFQATILPVTSKLTVINQGLGFKIGQVFRIQNSTGTETLIKVLRVNSTGGILNAEIIKFGINYLSDFTTTIQPSSNIALNSTDTTSAIWTISNTDTGVNSYPGRIVNNTTINTYASTVINGVTYTNVISGITGWGWLSNGTKVVFSVSGNGISAGVDYYIISQPTPGSIRISSTIDGLTIPTLTTGTNATTTITATYGAGSAATIAEQRLNTVSGTVTEANIPLSEVGYVSRVDYVTEQWVDGSYAGTILQEFASSSKNAATTTTTPATIQISLDALAKYPGYYRTNSGFLSDAVVIQDSYYYQMYSYVIKIDEKLDSYKAAVKTMLHPTGMALFGEYTLTNKFDLSLELESLVKYLIINLKEDPLIASEQVFRNIGKNLDATNNPNPSFVTLIEPVTNSFVGGATSNLTSVFNKDISNNKLYDNITYDDNTITPTETIFTYFFDSLKTDDVTISETTFNISDDLALVDAINTSEGIAFDTQRPLADIEILEESLLMIELGTNKYIKLPDQIITSSEFGYVVKNSYDRDAYFFGEYVNSRSATFSS